MSLETCRRALPKGLTFAFAAVLAIAAPAQAQYVQIQSFEITPFVGLRFGGSFDVQTQQLSQTEMVLKDASSYGFSAGVRFDDFSLAEFRWTRSTSELGFDVPFQPAGLSIGDVTLNQFHAQFTREFPISEVKGLRSFLTGSVGASHVASASDAFTRFSFGFGAGLKQFLGPHLAIRGEAQWLPIVIDPEVSAWACGTGAGGCLVILNGRLAQQFEMSVGPVLRF
ncbi:MAG TPA: outer membrane beta-barrel protein [Vicinamibacterales bacterium]|jgi:hypothetical protein